MNTTYNPFNLRHILQANAMFSFTSGLFFLLARNPLGDFLNASPILMIDLGVFLIGYAIVIGSNAQREEISRGFTLFTVIGDSGWVLASILLLVLPIFSFTADAKWAIGITAICVDIFAMLQFLEWRKMN